MCKHDCTQNKSKQKLKLAPKTMFFEEHYPGSIETAEMHATVYNPENALFNI